MCVCVFIYRKLYKLCVIPIVFSGEVMNFRESMRVAGFNQASADILYFLVENPGGHTVLDITKHTDRQQPTVSKTISTTLTKYIDVAQGPRGRGRPTILYSAKPVAELQAVLRTLFSATTEHHQQAMAVVEGM
jgi:predicted transcriptional regulator